MNDVTKKFLNKIKINTYIYTFLFMSAALFFIITFSAETSAIVLLLAAFAFYALGRQVNLVSRLEAGEEMSTMPTAPLWVRGVTYFIVMLLVLSLIFSLV